ncbi:MAG: transcriptional repressor NrdR [Acidimicrobiales bacterium]|nr:MAG: transcriptional repressor NrdR [Acidimicrobiales bacterium]
MRCPVCGHADSRVIDSRVVEEGKAIRRRRSCPSCGHRFTTFERVEKALPKVRKSSGVIEPFMVEKVEAGIRAAAKGRDHVLERATEVAREVAEQFAGAGEVTSEEIGIAVLERLRTLDEVAYMRFASVYKDFDAAADFQRELVILTKKDRPRRAPTGESAVR